MNVSPGRSQARGRADTATAPSRVGPYARMLCRWLDDELLMEVLSPTAAWLYCVLTMTSARAESDGWLSRRQAQRSVLTEDASDLAELVDHGLLMPVEADDRHPTPGYVLVRFASEQRLSDQIDAERQKNAERQATYRARRKKAGAAGDGVSNAVTHRVSNASGHAMTTGVSHAPSAVQTSAVQDSAVEDRHWIVPDVNPPAGPPGGPGGSTEAENSQSDPWLSHLDAPDPGHSPSDSGRALIFAALGDEPEDSLPERGGSGWWEQPLTDAQCGTLIGAGMHPERVVSKIRDLATSKRWREIDWGRVVGTQKIDKDTALRRGEKTRLKEALDAG